MGSSMDELAELLWGCVLRRSPKDDETSDRWQTDELAHLQEGFLIENMTIQPKVGRPMVAFIQPRLDRVVPLWMKAEDKLFARLRMDREEFLKRFEEARRYFLNENDEWKEFVRLTSPVAYGAVRNMGWVNAFAWILPSADPENAEQHRKIGRVMAALFYVELLSKFGDKPDSQNSEPLQMIDARWRIVNQQE